MFSTQLLEIPCGAASVAALVLGAICASLARGREARIVLAVGTFAVIPGLAWSALTVTTLARTGVYDAWPPFVGLWYLWIFLGGLGLAALLVDRPHALRTGILLRWTLGGYVLAWVLAAANGLAASAAV